MPDKKPPAKKKGGKSPLTQKLGPLPVYGWIIAAVGAFLVFKFVGGQSTSKPTPNTGDTAGKVGGAGDTSGAAGGASGGGAGDASGGGYDAYSALVDSLLQANQANTALFLGALGGGTAAAPAAGSSGKSSADSTNTGSSGAAAASRVDTLADSLSAQNAAAQTASGGAVGGGSAYLGSNEIFLANHPELAPRAGATPATQKLTTTVAQPFGGVVSVKTLPNGSVLTTFGSGRQVQKAPGKSPYVVKA